MGDVDGDGEKDIAVGREQGSLLLLNASDGSLKASGEVSGPFYWSRGGDEPPAGVALVDLDEDCAHEIVIAGYGAKYDPEANPNQRELPPRHVRVTVVDYNGGDAVVASAISGKVPYNYLTAGMSSTVLPVGSPVVADFDYDGEYKPDIIVTAANGAIYAFEYDPAENALSPKSGWPILLPEIAREPVLCRLGEDDQYSLVVQCEDGWLHVLDLPTGQATLSDHDEWPSYGDDRGNSRGKGAPCVVSGRRTVERDRPVTIRSIGPNPGRDFTIELSGEAAEGIQVEVYDATGRVVRRLDSGEAVVGSRVIHWDGRDDRGYRVPSGVYWCGTAGESRPSHRKLVVVR